jgi:two-component system nitrogen regulation response regulator GlnG
MGQIHRGSWKDGFRRLADSPEEAAAACEKDACSEEVLRNDLLNALAQNAEEFLKPAGDNTVAGTWVHSLKHWADQELSLGHVGILQQATPIFEKCMIEVALKHSGGRKRDASELLGWGRNTLTRKIKELGMESNGHDDEEEEA